MKVAFDHHAFALDRFGGGPRYVVELARRLPAHGVEASVVAPLHINNYLAADSARGFTRGRHLTHTFRSEFFGLPRVLELVNRFAAPLAWRGVDPDIVHETYYAMKPVGTARRRAVTVYDMIFELFPNEFRFVRQLISAKRSAIHRADHIICISATTQRDLLGIYDIDPARTSVVPLGHSLTLRANETRLERGEVRPSLLFVGIRSGRKNFQTLLQAYSDSRVLREFQLIAFGRQPLMPDERNAIRRLGIADRVRFESGSDRDLAARYQTATAFIYPSKYEGFGLPPLEAMGHGCPVVCSNAGSIPEVVGDAGVYFDPNDPEDLRTALERVVTTERLQADLRARGYARVAAFSWDRCAAETAQIYRVMM